MKSSKSKGATAARRHVLIGTIDSPPDHGGIQRMVHELARELASRCDVTLLAPRIDGSERYDAAAPFEVLRTSRSWSDGRLAVLAEMARLTRHERADAVISAHMNTLAPLALGAPRRPRAVVFHGSELWATRTRLLTRVLSSRATRGLAVSRFTAREAVKAGFPHERLSVTPLGAEITSGSSDESLDLLGLRTDGMVKPYLLTVSRLSEAHKGHDIVIRALPAILDRHPDVTYVVAGEGPLKAGLKALAEREGVASSVRFIGAVDDGTKAALLRACRAFVMVSRESRRPALFEGFGIAYIEAAIAGRPAIAGASGGTADAVVHGETGLLVDPLSPDAVTQAALRLLDDADYADRLGAKARTRALGDFTWDKAVARMTSSLETILR